LEATYVRTRESASGKSRHTIGGVPIASRAAVRQMTAARHERHPAAALAATLVGHTVVDATGDGEGVGDARLLLDDGTTILVDAELDSDPDSMALAEELGRPPWPRLLVLIGGRELWPFDQD
jgi:hypothetical protein